MVLMVGCLALCSSEGPSALGADSAPVPMLTYSRGAQGRGHMTRCVRPKMGMGLTQSSEPSPEPLGSLSENMGSAMAELASLNNSLFIWTVDFGAQGCLPEVPCCLASQWPQSSAGLPDKHQAAKDTQHGQAEVWLQEGSLGPFPHLSLLKFHVELGAEWHPIASEGGFLAVEGPASLSGSPALATVKERLSGNKSRSFTCHLPPARHRAGQGATKWSRTRHSLHPPTAPNVRGIQTLSRKPHQ